MTVETLDIVVPTIALWIVFISFFIQDRLGKRADRKREALYRLEVKEYRRKSSIERKRRAALREKGRRQASEDFKSTLRALP